MQQKTFRSKDMRRARTFATALLVAGLWLSGLPPPAPTKPVCRPTWRRSSGRKTSSTSGRSVVGVGDEQDKLVTVDVRSEVQNLRQGRRQCRWGAGTKRTIPGSPTIAASCGRRPRYQPHVHLRRAHRSGQAEAGAHHRRLREASGGVVGPHTSYALPGRMLLTGLSNNKDHGGKTAMVEYTNDGEYISTTGCRLSTARAGAVKTGNSRMGTATMCARLPRLNALVTSSFTGWNNYMMNLGKLMADPEAMKHFGNTVVVWDLHTLQPKKIFDVPGAPLNCAARGVRTTTTASPRRRSPPRSG